MAGNTVTLTFAGDSSKLERSFSQVGSKAVAMAGDLDKADSKTKALSGSMGKVGDVVDSSESKFMGTADVLDGLATTMGFNIDRQIELARGFGDLAGGLTNLGPLFSGVLAKLGAMVGITGAQAAATGTATASQWSLNAALSANPIGAVVVAIGLLVGAFVLAWKHSETFRNVVRGAFDVVRGAAEKTLGFFTGIPGALWSMANTVKDALLWPYKTAFNLIARAWNNTVGQLSFQAPSWVPLIGGKGFTMPRLPEWHTGGRVGQGLTPGAPVPGVLLAGETVQPIGAAGGGTTVIQLVVDGRVLTEIVHSGLLVKQRRTPLGIAS